MTNSADPDHLASSSDLIWVYTDYKGRVHPGSAGPGLKHGLVACQSERHDSRQLLS